MGDADRAGATSQLRARRPLITSLVVALATVIVAGPAAGCGGGGAPPTAAATTQIIVEAATVPSGELVYLRSCARCHGDAQQGKEDAPALDAVRLATAGDQGLRTLLAVGKGRMPAFGGLSSTAVDELVAYLRRST